MIVEEETRHIIQGEHRVSDRRNVVLTTVLGSCVAACLHDPALRIGGMNHFLLPDAPGSRDVRYASAAIEQLVNSLLKMGAQRGRLVAKLFGGARMLQGLPDIGSRNGEAAFAFLKSEGIAVAAHSLGGTHARRVRFWPGSGRAQQLLLVSPHELRAIPQPSPLVSGTVELF